MTFDGRQFSMPDDGYPSVMAERSGCTFCCIQVWVTSSERAGRVNRAHSLNPFSMILMYLLSQLLTIFVYDLGVINLMTYAVPS